MFLRRFSGACVFYVSISFGVAQSIDASMYVPFVTISDQLDVSSGNEAYDFEQTQGAVYFGVLQPTYNSSAIIVPLVYELITPGIQDGYNDVWEIENLSLIGAYEVKVFDNWDRLIFQSSDYHNDWNAEGVLTGVYRYLVIDKDHNVKYVGNLKIEN